MTIRKQSSTLESMTKRTSSQSINSMTLSTSHPLPTARRDLNSSFLKPSSINYNSIARHRNRTNQTNLLATISKKRCPLSRTYSYFYTIDHNPFPRNS